MLRAFALLAVLTCASFASSVVKTTPLPAGAFATGVQVDSAGNLYLAGSVAVSPGNPSTTYHGFVAKLSPDGSQTIWRTQLAGSGSDGATALALGPGGSVYVVGGTQSTDFPTSKGAFAGAGKSFAAKLDANGNVVYSTYLPVDSANAITVDSAGHAFITGNQGSGTLRATPGSVTGATENFLPGHLPYVLELDSTLSTAVVSIIGFGGAQIAVDGQGNIYAAGTFVESFAPTTPGAFQTTAPTSLGCGSSQVLLPCPSQHVVKIDPSGTKLIYATYIDGAYGAAPSGMAVDSAGNVILAGSTQSPDYPTTPDAYQPEYFSNPNPQCVLGCEPAQTGYVTKLNADGTALVWSTLFGGSTSDTIIGMTTDASGNIWLAGFAYSPDLPGLWNTPVAARPVAGASAPPGFVARLSADGRELSPVQVTPQYSFNGALYGGVIALNGSGNAVMVSSELVEVSITALGQVAAICDAADDAKVVSVAPGQLLTLYGSNLPKQVTFDGSPASLLYSSSNQINLQVPVGVAGQGQVTMQVGNEAYILAVVASQPSVFLNPASFSEPLLDMATCNGQSISGIQALAINADGTINSCANPAKAGSVVTIVLNGVGSAAQTVEIRYPSQGGNLNLPAQALSGALSGVALVSVPVPTASPTLFQVQDAAGTATAVRGPNVILWTTPPAKASLADTKR